MADLSFLLSTWLGRQYEQNTKASYSVSKIHEGETYALVMLHVLAEVAVI